jgi:hypothetical protein
VLYLPFSKQAACAMPPGKNHGIHTPIVIPLTRLTAALFTFTVSAMNRQNGVLLHLLLLHFHLLTSIKLNNHSKKLQALPNFFLIIFMITMTPA